MIRAESDPALRARQDWLRRRRRDRIFSAAGWALTALAVIWLLVIAVAGLRPA